MSLQHQALTKTARGHVERVGRDMYLAVLDEVNRHSHHEFMALDPFAAQQEAEAFCALNGMALVEFTVPPEVKQAHLADVGDFMELHTGQRIQPQYVSSIRKAV